MATSKMDSRAFELVKRLTDPSSDAPSFVFASEMKLRPIRVSCENDRGKIAHRHCRDDRGDERAWLHDLECLGNPLGRYHVCRSHHDRVDRLSVQPDPERVRALDHSVESGALGRPRRPSAAQYQPGAAHGHVGCMRTT